MKNILFLIFFLILKLSATEPNIDWVKYYGTNLAPANYSLSSVAVDDLGDIYGIGTYASSENSDEIHLIKFKSTGEVLWTKDFAFNSYESDVPLQIKIVNSNEIVVAANIYQENQGENFVVVKYNSAGDEVWHQIINGLANLDDSIADLKIDSNNNVVLFGGVQSSVNNYDYYISKIDINGNVLWEKTIDTDNRNELLQCGILGSNDKIYFTGCRYSSTNGYPHSPTLITICLDDHGNFIWQKKYEKFQSSYPYDENYISDMKLDNSGNILISGRSEWPCAKAKGSHKEALLLKYSADGDSLWKVNYFLPGFHSSGGFSSLTVGTDNSIYLTGYDDNNPFLVFKYNQNGSLIFKNTISGWTAKGELLSDNDDNMYSLATSAVQKIALIKINSSGILSGSATYSNSGDNIAANKLIKHNNNLYIAAATKGNALANDFTVLKYADCTFLKEYRYRGSQGLSKNKLELAIELSGQNKIFSGVSYHNENASLYTVKVNHNGETIWENIYDFQFGEFIFPKTINFDDFGNIYIAGYKSREVEGASGCSFLLKLNSDGLLEWIKFFQQNYTDLRNLENPIEISVINDQIFLMSNAKNYLGKNRGCLYKYDLSGTLLCQKTFDLSTELSTFIYGAFAEENSLLLSLVTRKNTTSVMSKNILQRLDLQFNMLAEKENTTYSESWTGKYFTIIKRNSENDIIQFIYDQGSAYFIKSNNSLYTKSFKHIDDVYYSSKMLLSNDDNEFLLSNRITKLNTEFDFLWNSQSSYNFHDFNFYKKNVLVVGSGDEYGFYGHISLKQVDSVGQLTWQKLYRPNIKTSCVGRKLFTDSDNKIYIAFESKNYSSASASYGLMCLSEGTGIQNPEFTKPKKINISNYPNPFNNSTTINYNLPASGSVKLSLINSLGQIVKRWQYESQMAGSHSLKLDGATFSSGIYYLQLSQGDMTNCHKMLMLK